MMGEMTHVSLLREGEPPPCRAQPSVRSAPAAPPVLSLLGKAGCHMETVCLPGCTDSGLRPGFCTCYCCVTFGHVPQPL